MSDETPKTEATSTDETSHAAETTKGAPDLSNEEMHPTVDELVASKAVDEAAERERYSPEAFIARELDRDDPDPDARYTDAEARVAAALLVVETERWGAPVTWAMLRLPHKRVALARAREFLRDNTVTSRIVRLLLGL